MKVGDLVKQVRLQPTWLGQGLGIISRVTPSMEFYVVFPDGEFRFQCSLAAKCLELVSESR